jgi:hypothetical protein
MPDYGYRHKQARLAYLAAFQQGQPCTRCRKPIWDTARVDLDHDDDDPTRYLGLAHRACNQGAGGAKARARERGRRTTRTPSRNW